MDKSQKHAGEDGTSYRIIWAIWYHLHKVLKQDSIIFLMDTHIGDSILFSMLSSMFEIVHNHFLN